MISYIAKKKLENFQPLFSVVDFKISKLLLKHPLKLIYYFLFKKFFYERNLKGKVCRVKTFSGHNIKILLPAGLDIYFFGLKSHPSEIALTKYLVKTLKPGDVFIDIGAHFGYYTLLASDLVGGAGKVIAIEASPETFRLLNLNTKKSHNIHTKNLAVCEKCGNNKFFVFPVYYSEFNTLNPEHYKTSKWYQKVSAREVDVSSITIQQLIEDAPAIPKMIKIDVEGAEDRVIKGGFEILQSITGVQLIMEYVNDGKNVKPYSTAESILKGIDYSSYIINIDGTLTHCPASILDYMNQHKLVSENVVFLKN
jgi:FkbM family methyltransferase